jgi:hypothetical protein
MIRGFAVDEASSARDVTPSRQASSPAAIKTRVVAYLGRLGFSDPGVIEALAEECLHRARRRAAPGSQEELLRRTLEEVQRRFDHAIALALDLAGSKDFRPVAGARAAILLGGAGISSDSLFHRQEGLAEMASALRAALPVATPPEANLVMPDQHISFLFSRSPKARK